MAESPPYKLSLLRSAPTRYPPLYRDTTILRWEYPCVWLIYYRWCGQLLLSTHSCSGLWPTPILQCPCLLSMPGCESLTFEQPLAGGYRYRRVQYINTLSRSRWWVAPTTTTVINMILCSTSSSLLMDKRPAAAYIFLWSFLGNIFLWSFFGKFQFVKSRLFSLWYDCYQSLWYDCYQVYFLRICSIAWLLRVPMRFKFLLQCCASSLWLLVIDVLVLQWFRKKRRSFYFWEEGCICFFSQQQVAAASILLLFFIPINLLNPKWSIKPFLRFVYKLVGGIANTLRGCPLLLHLYLVKRRSS